MFSFVPVSSLTIARAQARMDLTTSLQALSLNDRPATPVTKVAARVLTPLATAPALPSAPQYPEKITTKAKVHSKPQVTPLLITVSTPPSAQSQKLVYEKQDVLLTNVLSRLDIVNRAFSKLRIGRSLATHRSQESLSSKQRKVFKELRALLIPALKKQIDIVRIYLAKISELNVKLDTLQFEQRQLRKKFKKLAIPKLAERISESKSAITSVIAEKSRVPGKEVVDQLSIFESFQSTYVQNEEKYLRAIAKELLLGHTLRNRLRGFSTQNILDCIGSNMQRSKGKLTTHDKLTLPIKALSNSALNKFHTFLQNDPYRATLSAEGYTAEEYAALQEVVSTLRQFVLPEWRELPQQLHSELQSILQNTMSTDQNSPLIKAEYFDDYIHYFRSVFQKEPHENYYLVTLKSLIEQEIERRVVDA